MARELVFTVSDGGKVKAEAKGYTGRSCMKAMEPFVRDLKLGEQVVTEKPEIELPETQTAGGPTVQA